MEKFLENLMFNSRWLLAPMYVGLIFANILLLAKFGEELLHIAPHIFDSTESEVILAVLTLVDLSLVANLLIIVIFSGYENFVSKIDTAGHQDRPEWMGKVDYSGLKMKLIASIVAISGIDLLKVFVNVESYTNKDLAWKVGIHGMLVFTGVLFAIMDRVTESAHAAHAKAEKNEASGNDHR